MIYEKSIEKEIKNAYLDYAMSVIVGRAIPDMRDGLKPAQRRILYAMYENGWTHTKPTKKSARVVGEVLGKFHPHGDVSVYETMVHMAQEFSFRYPLISGQGNFGSVDGDRPAAMRYTECRLPSLSEEILRDIEKETVDFVDNFDASLKEPVLLPSRIPNILINGSTGIAVGMATNMVPHNLTEVIDALIACIDNENIEFSDLTEIIKGPDFPTGGIIRGRSGIIDAYLTGRGHVVLRARVDHEQKKNRFLITEIPFGVNKATLIKKMADLVKDGVLSGISDIRDESNRKEGVRVVIDLKKNTNGDVLLNKLFTHTQLQTKITIINLAIINNEPKLFTLKEMLSSFIDFRREIVTKRTEFNLKKTRERIKILDALVKALENIDEIIEIIRNSKNAREAAEKLSGRFELDGIQTKAILDLRLQSLTSLEVESLTQEREENYAKADDYRKILEDEYELLAVIKNELLEIRKKYGDDRRTSIEAENEEIDEEEFYEDREEVIILSEDGYIKRMVYDTYKTQGRGGVGILSAETKEGDSIKMVLPTKTRNWLVFFTNRGKAYLSKGFRMPEFGRHSRGLPIVNILGMESDERVCSTLSTSNFDGNILFATKKGLIKKTSLSEFASRRTRGKNAISLMEGDELVNVFKSEGNILMATKKGLVANFDSTLVRKMGRTARGVRGMRVKDDEVISAISIEKEKEYQIVSITENGFGKRTIYDGNYRETKRGAIGVKGISLSSKTGKLAGIEKAGNDDELLITSEKGTAIRVTVMDLSLQSRYARGVKAMKLRRGDRVKSFVVL